MTLASRFRGRGVDSRPGRNILKRKNSFPKRLAVFFPFVLRFLRTKKEKEEAATEKSRPKREIEHDGILKGFQMKKDDKLMTDLRPHKISFRGKRENQGGHQQHSLKLNNIIAKVLRRKRAVDLTDEEYRAQLQRNLEVYGLIDEWKEKQVELAMVPSKERYLLNQIDELRNKMNMSHGQNDPYYKAAVTEAIRREKEEAKLYEKEINEWWSKERKERRAYEKEHIEKYMNQTQAEHDKHEDEEEAMKQAQLKEIRENHEREMAERKAKGLPPDDYEQMLPIAKAEMEAEQKMYEKERENCPKTVDEFQKEFDGDVDLDQLRKNLEVYDLIEKWKKRQAKKEKEEAENQKTRKKREVVNVLKRLKRRIGKDSNGDYVEDMSRYHEGKRIHQQLDHDMKKYKDQGESDGAMSEVCREVMQKNNKFDQPDYRRKRDIHTNPKRQNKHSILNSKTALNMIKQNLELLKEHEKNDVKRPNVVHKNNLELEDFNYVRHENTSIYEYVYDNPNSQEATTITEQVNNKQRKAQDEFITDSVSSVSEEKFTGESSTQEQAEYKKKYPNRIMCCRDSLETKIQQMRKKKAAKLRRVRRAESENNTNIDIDNKEFNKQVDAMVEEHARKQKLFTGTPKKRPTAASEYPTKDDFVPFNRMTSGELKKFEEEDTARNRFGFFKMVNEVFGQKTTTLSESDEYGSFAKELLQRTTTTTTTTTSTKSPEERSQDKIQNLKVYIKTKLEDTAKKFSDALQFLDTTTSSAATTSESKATSHIADYYTLTYPPNPDDLLHKKNVTFAFGDSTMETTTPEVFTFSPLYTFIQHYNKYEDDPAVKEPAVIFSLTHPDYDTYSPMYKFHRYYHTLNESVDARTTETTAFAFERKDPTESFSLPTFEPEATVFIYNGFKTTEQTNTASQTGTTVSLKPEGKPTTTPDFEEGLLDELSDIRKFKPPNLEEIKKYIDSVTKHHEKFCKENFEWDSENSAYTLIEEEATTPTLSQKQREEDKAFIEALQKDGIRPSSGKPLEKDHETTKASDDKKETTVHQKEFNSFLQSLLSEHSNSSYPKQDVQLISKLINIFNNNSTAPPQQTTQDKNQLKKTLQNVLHKYSEEVLKSDKISNSTRKKFWKMKNMVRVLLENYVPNQNLDWDPVVKSPELDTQEKQRTFTDPEDYPINLRKQLNQALANFSDENESHQKRLKTMVHRILRNSFEHMHSSDVADEKVFTTSEDDEDSDIINDVCTDRRFKTDFRRGLKNLLRQYSKEVLGKTKDFTSREKRVNQNMLKILRTAVESYSFGPEADRLAHFFVTVSKEEAVTRKVTLDPNADIKKDLRAQVEHYMKTYRERGGEDSLEKDTNGKLKKLVWELLEDNSFEYTNSDIMEGNVKRLRTEPDPETEPTVTVLNTEERQEVEAERRLRTPTYDYYDSGEELHKYKGPADKTTLDYHELYKAKVTKKTTTTLSESQQARNEKFFKNMDIMQEHIDQQVEEHEKKIKQYGPIPKTPRITTRDYMETDETSEEEPITYRTLGPTVPRMEVDFSDSRQFEIPFYGITVTKSTMHSNENYYTPGQGFENRSTVPHSDEVRRARMSFRYDLANPALANATNVHVIGLDMLTPPSTTVDYGAFYRRRMRKTTTQEPIPTKDSAQRARDREIFLAQQEAFDAHINETVIQYAAGRQHRVTKVRPIETTMDSDLTEETSEEEPITYRTREPTVPRVEMDFSDSREYYVPILGITLTTGTRYCYTPGEGFENRTTIPPENEYERAKWRFKYDPWSEINRQMMEDAAQTAGQTTPLSQNTATKIRSDKGGQQAGKGPTSGSGSGGLFNSWKRKWFGSKLYNKTVGHWKRIVNDGSGSQQWKAKVDDLIKNGTNALKSKVDTLVNNGTRNEWWKSN
uniref:Uncharacterized protein n=1 Tax=Cacopsylla melanoneura TaxID=428564 RepID=A0A8D8WCG9_9HEMI